MLDNIVTYQILNGSEMPSYDALGYQYLMAGNGVFIRTDGRFFSAVVPVSQCTIRGLATLKPQFHLHVPQLPATLLSSVLADARRARAPHNERILHETLYHFHHLGHAVQVKKQPQQATVGSVKTAGDGGADVICDLHSHGQMPPFWSDTDNKDELGARIYIVIGRLDSTPEIRLRVGVYGCWHSLPVTAVFDGDGGFIDLHNQSKKEKYP